MDLVPYIPTSNGKKCEQISEISLNPDIARNCRQRVESIIQLQLALGVIPTIYIGGSPTKEVLTENLQIIPHAAFELFRWKSVQQVYAVQGPHVSAMFYQKQMYNIIVEKLLLTKTILRCRGDHSRILEIMDSIIQEEEFEQIKNQKRIQTKREELTLDYGIEATDRLFSNHSFCCRLDELLPKLSYLVSSLGSDAAVWLLSTGSFCCRLDSPKASGSSGVLWKGCGCSAFDQ